MNIKTLVSIFIAVIYSCGDSHEVDSCFKYIGIIDSVSSKIVHDDPKLFYSWRIKSIENDSIAKNAFSDFNLRKSKVNRNIILGSITYSVSWIGVLLLAEVAQNDNNGNTGIPGWMEYSLGIPCIAVNFTGLLLLVPGGIIPKYFSRTISEDQLLLKYRNRNATFGISR